jgi:predicted DNA-binding protein (MmcQ/YjbR family)
MSFEGLTEIEGIRQAPYFAKRQWVSVDKGAALSDPDLKAYVAASYRMVASKLTRKLRAELGLSEG